MLLKGRPGSGKSTALVRLLLEESRKPEVETIPVLVELRYFRTSVLDLILDFLTIHQAQVSREEVEQALKGGQLFLLVDGVNELPSGESLRDLTAFRRVYNQTPMVFTTRDLGVGGDLGIERKLAMQPLTEAQMKDFVCGYLPEGKAKKLLGQLSSRLREFGQTPLLLWMLCQRFDLSPDERLPQNLGELFSLFTQTFYRAKEKEGNHLVASRTWQHWSEQLLRRLAFGMMGCSDSREMLVAITKSKVIVIFEDYLREKEVHDWADRALSWLDDLLNHHLLEVRQGEKQIAFKHQLIQEYYAAVELRSRLDSLCDEQLQREYLNFVKWTEAVALMLGIESKETQALRVAQLAREVDLLLGARLAGVVKPEFQAQAIRFIEESDYFVGHKVELWERTRSEKALSRVLQAMQDEDSDVRHNAVEALGKLGSEKAIPGLLLALQDKNVQKTAAKALGNLGSEQAIPELLQALQDENAGFCWIVVDSLGQIGSKQAIPGLIQALQHKVPIVRWSILNALEQIGSEKVIPVLLQALKDESSSISRKAAELLGQIGNEKCIPGLIQALIDKNGNLVFSPADALVQLGSEQAIPGLLHALQHEDAYVSMLAKYALIKIGSKQAIAGLLQILKQEGLSARWIAEEVLRELGSQQAIPILLKALEHEDSDARWRAAEALGKIGNKQGIPGLLQSLQDEDPGVRWRAAEALGKIRSERAISGLIQALQDEDPGVRWRAAEALGKIRSERAISGLIQGLEHEDSVLRWITVVVLKEIGNEKVITELLQTLQDEDSAVSKIAADALRQMRFKQGIPGLLQALQGEDSVICKIAEYELGKSGVSKLFLG